MDPWLSIIIPAFNEEENISDVINELLAVDLNVQIEIIVVDDGSDDETSKIANEYEEISLINHEVNKGKGEALKTGLNAARGKYILIQDADMEYHPEDIPLLIEPVIESDYDVVYGSRFLGDSLDKMKLSHKIGNKVLSLFTRILYRINTTDMETGYKLFKHSLIMDQELKANSFNIEPELTAIFAKQNATFTEVPITYRSREFGTAKIGWSDGIIALWWLIKYKFIKIN